MPEPVQESLRLFVAISLPEEVKTQVAVAQAALRRECDQPELRWTRREQLHLTLKFLGAVNGTQVENLTRALADACATSGPLTLRAENLGFFPADAHAMPRVIWVGVRDLENRLPDLQQAIEAACGPFTTQEPEGRFAGHVTLARVKGLNRPRAKTLKAAVAMRDGSFFGHWECTEIELLRSELSAAGARHSCLARLPLQKFT